MALRACDTVAHPARAAQCSLLPNAWWRDIQQIGTYVHAQYHGEIRLGENGACHDHNVPHRVLVSFYTISVLCIQINWAMACAIGISVLSFTLYSHVWMMQIMNVGSTRTLQHYCGSNNFVRFQLVQRYMFVFRFHSHRLFLILDDDGSGLILAPHGDLLTATISIRIYAAIVCYQTERTWLPTSCRPPHPHPYFFLAHFHWLIMFIKQVFVNMLSHRGSDT